MTAAPFSKPELLAPAGDLLRAKTAILYGADAVYLGGKKYSLRSRAGNFSMADIREACAFAHDHGSHIHVTVNEIPHAHDLEGIEEYLHELQECGVTAIIAASPAIMRLAKETTSLQVHCSTQMSITNSAAAKLLHTLTGCDRIVPGRECSLSDIRTIVKETGLEIEVFIHGGMCVNYSGRCILSNQMTLRDANRGGCAQSCRWHYRLYENDMERSREDALFTMGSRDLCAASLLYELMEAGAASFKIEGRMKTEFYVASIVRAYRSLIDDLFENHGVLSEEALMEHERELLLAQNRETCKGNYEGIGGSESIIYHEHTDADVNHVFLGTVVGTFENGFILETRNPFSVGDVMEIMEPAQPTRRFVITEMEDSETGPIEKSRVPMRHIRIQSDCHPAIGSLVRKGIL